MTRGGKRKGAGTKKKDKAKQITAYVSDYLHPFWKKIRKKREWLEEKIKEDIEKSKK